MSRPECGRVTEATKQTQCPVSTNRTLSRVRLSPCVH